MYFQSSKIAVWVSLVMCLLFWHHAAAQRFQLQVQVGANFSKGVIHDNGQSLRKTSTHFDTFPNAQFGLALHAQLLKRFYLRLDGSYRAYRTFFNTEEDRTVGKRYILGNLYNEKFNFALLPEFRGNLSHADRSKLFGYVFAGPVLSFEKKKNYSNSFVIENGGETIVYQIKPDAQAGLCLGAGINPQLGRFGMLLETRYTRFPYANEGLVVGKIAYGHFTVLVGLSINLGK